MSDEKVLFPQCGGRMRSLSDAQPGLGEAGWGVAHRQVRALESAPVIVSHLASDSARALCAFSAMAHPAPARITALAKPAQSSPASGEGEFL